MTTKSASKAGERTHTPGPWRARKNGDISTHDEDFESEIVIAHTSLGNGIDPFERDGNARLIAAAPELFSSLIEGLRANDGAHSINCAAITALAPCNCWLSRAECVLSKVEGTAL